MKCRRYKRNGVVKHMSIPAVLLATVVSLVLVFSFSTSRADDDGEEMPFKDAEIFIEYNSTAGDTGIQVFLDDDNWRKITIEDPNEKKLFMVKGKTALGRQGLTELFFESVEPELSDQPLMEFMQRFPEGEYKFEGIRNDGIELESDVEFTHVIPCGPEVMPAEGTVIAPDSEVVISWEDVEEVVDPAGTDNTGETVCTDPESLGQDLEIDIYQVIVENDDVNLIVDLTSSDNSLTVPPEILRNNTLYIFEVLAKEESGNQTITEGYFCTGPDLEEDNCADLFESL